MSASVLSARAHRFADELAAWPYKRASQDNLWRLLDRVDPATRGDVSRRQLLVSVLAELVAAGVVEMPGVGSFDQTVDPSLPRYVTVLRQARAGAVRAPVVWHPELAWVQAARLSGAQAEAVEAVNRWLFQVRVDEPVVPSRERSLEVFGHEKALDRWGTTGLFAPERLSLSLLRCRRVAPSFVREDVGAGSVLLVVENSDTFDSLVTILRSRSGHPVGVVGWGAGGAFEASVLSVARMERPVSTIAYFGDLDAKGLQVPLGASAVSVAAGLPPVRPVTGLYEALFELGVPQPGQKRVTAAVAAELSGWLDARHEGVASRLLLDGERLAQEAVGVKRLNGSDEWLRGLA